MKNILGHNSYLQEQVTTQLESLNESLNNIIKNDLRFKSIKNVNIRFSEEDSKNILLTCFLKSGETAEVILGYFGNDDEYVTIEECILDAYYPVEKVELVRKHIEDGTLSSDYLKAYEPELFQILIQESNLNSFNHWHNAELKRHEEDAIIKLIENL